jgi:hypothetical protein
MRILLSFLSINRVNTLNGLKLLNDSVCDGLQSVPFGVFNLQLQQRLR